MLVVIDGSNESVVEIKLTDLGIFAISSTPLVVVSAPASS